MQYAIFFVMILFIVAIFFPRTAFAILATITLRIIFIETGYLFAEILLILSFPVAFLSFYIDKTESYYAGLGLEAEIEKIEEEEEDA